MPVSCVLAAGVSTIGESGSPAPRSRHSRACACGPSGAAACPQTGLWVAGHHTYRHLRHVRYGRASALFNRAGRYLAGRALRGDTPRVGADNPAWVSSEAGGVRARPVALTLMAQVRGWKQDTDLGNRLTDQAVGLFGRDAVLAIIGLQDAGNLPDCCTPAREQRSGRVLTEGRAAVIEAAEAASQVPADHNPEVYDKGCCSRVDAWTGQLGLAGLPPLCRHPRCPAPGDGLARGWLWRCRGWWSKERGG
jgi:hypothetical protein